MNPVEGIGSDRFRWSTFFSGAALATVLAAMLGLLGNKYVSDSTSAIEQLKLEFERFKLDAENRRHTESARQARVELDMRVAELFITEIAGKDERRQLAFSQLVHHLVSDDNLRDALLRAAAEAGQSKSVRDTATELRTRPSSIQSTGGAKPVISIPTEVAAALQTIGVSATLVDVRLASAPLIEHEQSIDAHDLAVSLQRALIKGGSVVSYPIQRSRSKLPPGKSVVLYVIQP